MILKNISNKSKNQQGRLIRYVLKYVLNPQKATSISRENSDLTKSNLVLLHNINTAKTVEDIIETFKIHESFRIRSAKSNTILNHTIISTAPLDQHAVNYTVLHDLAHKFISLRGTNNIYVACPHFDKSHAHIHIVYPNILLNGTTARISKERFKQIKLSLTEYQKSHLPQLTHSLPDHEKSKNTQSLLKHIQNSRQTDKKEIMKKLIDSYNGSHSKESFLQGLEKTTCSPYYRNEKLQGFEYNFRKYRLKTLGLHASFESLIEHDLAERAELNKLKLLRQELSHSFPSLTLEHESETSLTEIDAKMQKLAMLRNKTVEKSCEIETSELSDEMEMPIPSLGFSRKFWIDTQVSNTS